MGGVRIECDHNKILPMVNLQRAINIAASWIVRSVKVPFCFFENREKKKFRIQVKVQMHKKSISV